MKTINDLLQLIKREIELNEGKILQYNFIIDTDDMYLTMREHAEFCNWESGELVTEKQHKKTIFSLERFDTPERLQYVYWKVFCNGRSRLQKENWNEYSIPVGINLYHE